MSSILDTISSIATPDMIRGLGKQFGLSDELVRQGMTISNVVLTGGMARAASTPDGAAAVAELVGKADSSLLGNLSNVVANAAGMSDNTASKLFGSNLDLITSGVKKATGIDIVPLLGVAAPVLLGVIKNMSSQQGLDADGIARLLQGEVRGLARRDPASAKVFKEIIKPLEAQDKLKSKFNDDEWVILQRGALYTTALIMLADHSGGAGREKEIRALQATLSDAVTSAGPAELNSLLFRENITESVVNDVVKSFRRNDEAETRTALLNSVTSAVGIAKAKAPKADAIAYQGLLLAVAQQVAGAAKEGGFLGMGGTNVSGDEKAMIDSIAAAIAAG